jgi:hypothetical protein
LWFGFEIFGGKIDWCCFVPAEIDRAVVDPCEEGDLLGYVDGFRLAVVDFREAEEHGLVYEFRV